MCNEMDFDAVYTMIVLKLGGSSITKKSEGKFEMNSELVDSIAHDIAAARKKSPGLRLIIVCGVGAFGHTNVTKYDINDGVRTAEQIEGVTITNASCRSVGEYVVRALKSVGLHAQLVDASTLCVQTNKKVSSFNEGPYAALLSKGIIPVSTGIMVSDTKLGWSVCSGDQIIGQVALKLHAQQVYLGTDVDGIFTADPHDDPDAQLIESITSENVQEVIRVASASKAVDVTGGMKGKLEKLAATLPGINVCIFNLFTPGNLTKVLEGKPIKGTKILL